eukprot:700720-Alexandrium_andersonii.AAC.1
MRVCLRPAWPARARASCALGLALRSAFFARQAHLSARACAVATAGSCRALARVCAPAARGRPSGAKARDFTPLGAWARTCVDARLPIQW